MNDALPLYEVARFVCKRNKMQIGNIIKAYRKGYHVVTDIQRRFVTNENHRYYPDTNVGDEISPLVSYRQLTKDDFTPVNRSRVFACDGEWCHVVTPDELETIIRRVDTFGNDLIQLVTQRNVTL